MPSHVLIIQYTKFYPKMILEHDLLQWLKGLGLSELPCSEPG